uniref:Adhesin n=1 Tax=Rhabditophanes sp. KR3021 TaxID=114890 RepID=A0AC35TWE7_9BILA
MNIRRAQQSSKFHTTNQNTNGNTNENVNENTHFHARRFQGNLLDKMSQQMGMNLNNLPGMGGVRDALKQASEPSTFSSGSRISIGGDGEPHTFASGGDSMASAQWTDAQGNVHYEVSHSK